MSGAALGYAAIGAGKAISSLPWWMQVIVIGIELWIIYSIITLPKR